MEPNSNTNNTNAYNSPLGYTHIPDHVHTQTSPLCLSQTHRTTQSNASQILPVLYLLAKGSIMMNGVCLVGAHHQIPGEVFRALRGCVLESHLLFEKEHPQAETTTASSSNQAETYSSADIMRHGHACFYVWTTAHTHAHTSVCRHMYFQADHC